MNHFKTVKFVNLSVSALGVFDQESSPFIEMLKKLNLDSNHQKYVIRKIINIAYKINVQHLAVETKNGRI